MNTLTRRRLLEGSAATFVFMNLPAFGRPRARRRSPNEEIRCAVIGLRGRGRSHVDALRAMPDVKVVALCDADREVLASAEQGFVERGEKVDTYVDLRKVIERDDVDVIATATPNHWHALIAVWACQAGKDVYLEKPVSHDIWEGRQIVKAARKHGRIVQTGTQSRSSFGIREGIEWMQAGNLGAIEVVRGFCYKPRQSIGKVDGPTKVPEGVDYDLWTGPAPMKPLMRRNLHYDWHWVFDTGNGDLGNQGIHQMDLCRWALGAGELARGVLSIGGRFGYDDDGDTPNTQIVLFDYEKAPLVFEVRGLPRDLAAQQENWGGSMDRYRDVSIGVVVECAEGSLVLPDYHQAQAYDSKGQEVRAWEGADDHFADFIAAVRSRKPEDLSADILEGHLSSALCHMGNVSYRRGQLADPDEIHRRISDAEVPSESFERFCRHLEANGVDLAKTRARVGPWLAFDPAQEVFNGDEAADAMRKGTYREPFVVPEEV